MLSGVQTDLTDEELYVTDSRGITTKADSKEEVWISNALRDLKKKFYFQYNLFGGRTKGGLLVDWVVYPGPVAVEFKGGYWHTGRNSAYDIIREAKIKQVFRRLVIYDNMQITSEKAARDHIRKDFQ